jgi:toxin CptA
VGPVTCDIQYSGRVGAIPCAAAVATGSLLFAMPLPVATRVALLLWILLVCLGALRRLRTWVRIRLDVDGGIDLVAPDGTSRHGQVRPGCCVLPWLVVIRWRPAAAWFDRTVLLLPPMLDPAAFRALRVLLRWQKP